MFFLSDLCIYVMVVVAMTKKLHNDVPHSFFVPPFFPNDLILSPPTSCEPKISLFLFLTYT